MLPTIMESSLLGDFSSAQDHFDNRSSLISVISYAKATNHYWFSPSVTQLDLPPRS